MLATCEKYAAVNNIRFSTHDDPGKSKSKALHVTGVKGGCAEPAPLVLCGKALPWVDTCEHLGHTLSVTASMNIDCKMKRAQFISDAVKIRENFNFAHPIDIIEATEKYCLHHYGSNLWSLRGEVANMLYSSWNTNTKLVWNLPRKCRSYFIGSVLAPDITPPRVSLMTRFLKFFHGLLDADSREIQVLCRLAARDIRTSLGSNLKSAREETGLDPWVYGGQRMKQALLEYNHVHIPEGDEWRVPFLSKLLQQRLIQHYD